jgi:murein DD-endopeptidase MepM/ murein hydrolase activator NlpD
VGGVTKKEIEKTKKTSEKHDEDKKKGKTEGIKKEKRPSTDKESTKTDAIKAPKMIYPLKGEVISKFGDIKDGFTNDGMNIKAPRGTKVKSAGKGTVIYVGNKLEEDYGNIVIIQHDNGLITSYAHLNDISVKKDAKVQVGDVIGSVGKTGDVTEPQLYFEIMKDKKPVNPSKYLSK